MGLSDKQRLAVERTGQDVCIVAGPGSGKTRVLIERFRWLVDRGISPLNILAITFTEKAATEIKQRLVESFKDQPEVRGRIERAYVSTIHGFCNRLLKEHAIAAGLDPEFTVFEGLDSKRELQDAANAALNRLYSDRPGEFGEMLDAIYSSTELASSLIKLYEALRTAGRSVSDLRKFEDAPLGVPLASVARELQEAVALALDNTPKRRERKERLLEWADGALELSPSRVSKQHFDFTETLDCNRQGAGAPLSDFLKKLKEDLVPQLKAALATEYYAGLRSILVGAVEEMDRIYRGRKQELSALDFSDLEELSIALLRKKPQVCASVQAHFRQILMDELQDTNPLQWALVHLLRSPDQFFAVGDINQSIFGFRHADPGLFRGYREEVESRGQEVDELYENHRSRADILAASELILRDAEGIEPRTLNPKRPLPGKTEPSVEVIAASAETSEETAGLEARWVARRVRELMGTLIVEERKGETRITRPARYRDVAVLVRTYSAMPEFQQAFAEFDIPCLTAGGKYFYEAREVVDLIHLLRVIANSRDEIALAGVLRSPLAGVSDETLLRLRGFGANLGAVLLGLDRKDTSAFDAGDLERLLQFRQQLLSARAVRDDVSPDHLLARILDESAYEEGLDARARANIDKFLAQLRAWHSQTPAALDKLVKDIDWMRGNESEPDAPPDDSSDVVRLMTVHQSKGLQFPIVFLSAMHRGRDKTRPLICVSSEGALGACWRNPANGDKVPDTVHLHRSREQDKKENAEENRLLYVAMTRAEEQLIFTFANTKHARQNWAGKVIEGLSIGLDQTDEQPVLHQPPSSSFQVRLFRANQAPEVPPAATGAVKTGDEVSVLARPRVSALHDSTASVTSVAVFAACPRRYYLGHYLGWRDGTPRPRPDEEEEHWRQQDEMELPGAAEFGVMVHSLLAGEPADGAPPEAMELAARFQASQLGQRAKRAQRAEREFDFLLNFEGIVLRGQIDLWFEEGGELVLVDYKTDTVTAEEAGRRAEAYAIQLRLYAIALERLVGRRPASAWLCFLRPDVARSVGLEQDRLEDTQTAVRVFREAQSSLKFELREAEHCLRCEFYRGLCPAGGG